MGPYTITQLLVFVTSIYLLLTYRGGWAHFGPFNVVIGVGVPVALTYAARYTRIEGRDPLRAGVALAMLLLQPGDGYLGGAPVRAGVRVRCRPERFPVAGLPAALASPRPTAPTAAAAPAHERGWVTDLVAEAARVADARR